ncbi:dipeptide/oligopeptide/nickel ABC transporter permease/ATP-binding protein [Amycolatopsis sacchari]|uniref:dipeptide/oligopeptide/nickel ABC transporter permease/ATP-binding protein n=1 Tax=Amycolatopsis sacchari TaxID=115433 RepID=UPI003D728134
MTVIPQAATAPVQRARIPRAVARRPLGLVCLGFLVLVVVAAVAAPLLAPYDPTATDLFHTRSGPSALHPFGTDSLGRDVLSRLMYGGRVTLTGVGEAVLTALVVGVSAGLAAGFAGGWTDRIVSWLVDLLLAIPVVVTLLVVVAVVGSNETLAMIAFGFLGSPALARVVRGATLVVRQELYISAAYVAGLPTAYIVTRHVLPRVAGPIIVQTALFAGSAVLAETGLGYLGLGVQQPTPSWGNGVADASHAIDQQPWLLVPSGLVIALTVLAFGLLGDTVRDATVQRDAPPQPRPKARTRPAESTPDSAEPEPAALLSMRNVTVALNEPGREVALLEDLSLHVGRGETVGLVGESGCGKSMTGRAVLGLLPAGAAVTRGRIRFGDEDLTTMSQTGLRRLRGAEIALISQEPLASLDPVFTVGHQLDELVRRHRPGSRKAVRARSVELLEKVNLPEPEQVARRYVHELSGGMAQRVSIAMALSGNPKLLIADEPTTALDVTVQAEILDLLRGLQRDTGLAILLISHDWGVVADLCSRAYVMYAGQIVETGEVTELFDRPRHPYTTGLLGSMPRRGTPRTHLPGIPGSVPDPGDWPAGCHFADRCALATEECTLAPIPLLQVEPEHRTRCLHHEDVARGQATPVDAIGRTA